jgi:hypothetical protein
MKLSDRLYNVLKWLVLVCIPALTTAYVGFDAIFKWGYADTVAKVSAIVCTLIGSLIGISTAEYNRAKKEE